MNVLSLYDGISGIQQVFKNLGIKPDRVFVSEIDKTCEMVTMQHFPDSIMLGPVENIDGYQLPEIDLLIGGPPCQSFSTAKFGPKENFNSPNGNLVLEYIRLFKEIRPKWFLMENVVMGTKPRDFISAQLGLDPHLIDSQIFIPQKRRRYYWTNLLPVAEDIEHIPELSILNETESKTHLSEYLDKEVDDKYFMKPLNMKYIFSDKGFLKKSLANPKVAHTITRTMSKRHRANADTYITEDIYPKDRTNVRALTPKEVSRLQGYPDDYLEMLSDTKIYNLMGNSFCLPVIELIINNMKYVEDFEVKENKDTYQLKLDIRISVE